MSLPEPAPLRRFVVAAQLVKKSRNPLSGRSRAQSTLAISRNGSTHPSKYLAFSCGVSLFSTARWYNRPRRPLDHDVGSLSRFGAITGYRSKAHGHALFSQLWQSYLLKRQAVRTADPVMFCRLPFENTQPTIVSLEIRWADSPFTAPSGLGVFSHSLDTGRVALI